ncbi:MAG: peptidyl-prolyl cis-trans isomerase [Verrucomicrobia bacterium]|nr:peptidyl-prolyl cis-trans isomerase [Verrucomicrobiota bacterium]
MISWIQRTFQQHFRIVFGLVLIGTIISFIIGFSPTGGINQADRQSLERHFFGYNLGSREDQSKIINDANLSIQLQYGYSGLDESQLQNYGLQRIAALELADRHHLPATTAQEITEHIKTLRTFAGDNGQFDAKRYDTFRTSLSKSGSGLTEATVARVMGDDVRIEKLRKLISGPGYVLPADVKAQLERVDSQWTLGVATVDYASFNPAISVNDADLAKFFAERSSSYQIPPRISVSYVDFSAVSYLAAVTVTEAEVRAFYDANPGRFPKPPVDPKAAAKPDAAGDFAAVRAQVEAELKLERARQVAAKAASDFSFALYDGKITIGSPAFEQLLAAHKLTLKPLAPFSRENGPAEFGGSPDVAEAAFSLNASRVYSDAVSTPVGAVVLFWKELIPARNPLLSEVHDKVVADYKKVEKSKRIVDLGRTLRTVLEGKLKAGETFEKAVADAASSASVKITAKLLPPFTRRQPPQDLNPSVASALDYLEKGRVSDLRTVGDQGIMIYVADKKLPDLSETNPQYVATREQLAEQNAQQAAGSYLNEVVQQELKKSEPASK